MKRLLILLLFLSVPFSAQAEDGVKRETVEELLSLMRAEKMMDAMYAQIDKMVADLPSQLDIQESERPIFDRYVSRVTAVMKEEMSWDKMKEMTTTIYMKHFTEKEVADLVAFYRTESGQAMIEKMPLVMQETMLLSQSMMQDAIPKLKELSEELGEELRLARAKEK